MLLLSNIYTVLLIVPTTTASEHTIFVHKRQTHTRAHKYKYIKQTWGIRNSAGNERPKKKGVGNGRDYITRVANLPGIKSGFPVPSSRFSIFFSPTLPFYIIIVIFFFLPPRFLLYFVTRRQNMR
jgi:hypothetical protein